MNYRTERQETKRQNKSRFEEAYFQTAFNVDNYNDNSKEYTYEIPQQFATNPSQEKMIGLRRVKLTPIMANTSFRVNYDNNTAISAQIDFRFQPENTLQEIYDSIVEQTQTATYTLFIEYDGYNLRIVANDASTNTYDIPFYFEFQDSTRDGANVLWQILNQTGDPFPDMFTYNAAGAITAISAVDEIALTNVWSRKALHVHASFSNSMTRFLCLSDDFYEIVNKYFEDNTHRSTFTLSFTTNGTQKITPYSAQILTELCYKIRH